MTTIIEKKIVHTLGSYTRWPSNNLFRYFVTLIADDRAKQKNDYSSNQLNTNTSLPID